MAFFHKVTKATTQDGEHEMAENEKKKKNRFPQSALVHQTSTNGCSLLLS